MRDEQLTGGRLRHRRHSGRRAGAGCWALVAGLVVMVGLAAGLAVLAWHRGAPQPLRPVAITLPAREVAG